MTIWIIEFKLAGHTIWVPNSKPYLLADINSGLAIRALKAVTGRFKSNQYRLAMYERSGYLEADGSIG